MEPEPLQGHLFDRRQLRRTLHATWGINSHSDEITTCVRRFGRKSVAPGGRRRGDHITGAQMAASNGHEVSEPEKLLGLWPWLIYQSSMLQVLLCK